MIWTKEWPLEEGYYYCCSVGPQPVKLIKESFIVETMIVGSGSGKHLLWARGSEILYPSKYKQNGFHIWFAKIDTLVPPNEFTEM